MAGTMDIAVVYNDDDSYPSQPAPMSTPMLTNPSAAGGAPSAKLHIADVSMLRAAWKSPPTFSSELESFVTSMDAPVVLTSMNAPRYREYLVGHNRPRASATLKNAVVARRCNGGWVTERKEARARTKDTAVATW